jgi:hypothetical protein
VGGGAILTGGPQLAARGERKKGKEKALTSGPQPPGVSDWQKKEKRGEREMLGRGG